MAVETENPYHNSGISRFRVGVVVVDLTVFVLSLLRDKVRGGYFIVYLVVATVSVRGRPHHSIRVREPNDRLVRGEVRIVGIVRDF